MVLTYFDAATLLFRESEFTAAEFSRRTGNPRAAKVLSEMKKRGLVARTGRGRYRCLRPSERPDLRGTDLRRVWESIRSAPYRSAWTGPTAVLLWTDGGYEVAPTVFRPEFHLAVEKKDLRRWRRHLRAHRLPVESRKRLGPRLVLHPKAAVRSVELDGHRVVTRDETLRIVRGNPFLYEGAEEWFRD